MRVVLNKELLEAQRDGRLRVSFIFFFALALAVTVSAFQQAQSHARARSVAEAHERERWLNQGEKTPHAAAHYGVYAFRPAGPLALFDPGLSAHLGTTVYMEAHSQNAPQFPAANDTETFVRFGPLTPAAMFGVLLPLLILVLAGTAVTTERERGTLRQLLAQGVSGRQLLQGKATAITALLLILITPLLIVFAALIALYGTAFDTAFRFMTLVALISVFSGMLLLVALSVSTLADSTRAALGVLIGFWLLGALVMPRLAMEWADLTAPTPRGPDFRAALKRDLDDRAPLEEAVSEVKAALLKEFGVSDTDELPIGFNGLRLHLVDQAGYEAFDRHYGALLDGYLEQEQRFQRAGWISPFVAFTALSAGLAGTDLIHYSHFLKAAEAYRRLIQDRMSLEMTRHPSTDGGQYVADPSLWSEIPEFTYIAPSFSSVWAHYRTSLAALLFWVAGAVISVSYACNRLRP